MTLPASVRVAVLVTVIASLVVAGAGGSSTAAAFFDSERGIASVTAADTFDGTPPGNVAYDDANGNGRWDQGEATYTETQLYNFDNTSVDLVIPADVGTVKDNGGLSIRAASITSEVALEANKGSIDLDATGGAIDLAGQTVATKFGSVTVDAATTVDLSGATVDARYHKRQAPAGGDVAITANGDVDLSNAALTGDGGDLTADLGTTAATLSVGGASLSDTDDTLVYSPSGATVSGTPASGSVTS